MKERFERTPRHPPPGDQADRDIDTGAGVEVVEAEHRRQMPVHRGLGPDRRGAVEQDHLVSRGP